MHKSVKILKQLEKLYDKDFFAKENKNDPFRILISCILSLRTRDEVTFPVTKRLFSNILDIKQMSEASPDKIANLIYPVGFYKVKAANIQKIASILLKEYSSRVPDEIDELLKLPGVGRKTANLVVSVAYNKPGICVDIHVHRIFNRLGLIDAQSPLETEMALREMIPIKYWRIINGVFVRHGQQICKPRKPLCEQCPINRLCEKINI